MLRNRGAGPFGLLNLVDERCGGTFDNIDDVIPPKERAEFMAGYKAAAGFAIERSQQGGDDDWPGARVRVNAAVLTIAKATATIPWQPRRGKPIIRAHTRRNGDCHILRGCIH